MAHGSNQFRVRLDDETAEIVRQLAERLDQPASKVLGEWIAESRPLMSTTLAIIAAADQAQDEVKAQLFERLGGLESAALDFIGSFEDATAGMHGAAHLKREEGQTDGVGVRARADTRGGGQPPYTNRGAPKSKRQPVAEPKTGKS